MGNNVSVLASGDGQGVVDIVSAPSSSCRTAASSPPRQCLQSPLLEVHFTAEILVLLALIVLFFFKPPTSAEPMSAGRREKLLQRDPVSVSIVIRAIL